MTNEQDFTKQAEKFRERYHAVKDEIGKVIVGHDEIIHGVLTCMMIGGHCLLEGCLLYTSPSPRDQRGSRMPSSA